MDKPMGLFDKKQKYVFFRYSEKVAICQIVRKNGNNREIDNLIY